MSKFKVPVFLSTVIICPNCGRAIDILPPAMEEAISDGDKLTCVACNADLIIRIQVPARAAEQRNGAERAGADESRMIYSCPKCGNPRNRYDDYVQYCLHCGDDSIVLGKQ